MTVTSAVQPVTPWNEARVAAIETAVATIPAPASTVPPAVAADSALGTVANYAKADHTHASSMQAARLQVSGTGGLVTWTYPKAYATNPVMTATVENVSGATQPFVVNIVGQAGLTSASFQVFKAAPVTLPALAASLLNYVVNIFSNAPSGTYINVVARLPS